MVTSCTKQPTLGKECFDLFKDKLKDPYSAQYEGFTMERKSGLVNVNYRAKNTFGAYVPGRFQCVLSGDRIDELASTNKMLIDQLK